MKLFMLQLDYILFLNTGRECCGREAIDLDVKILMSLRMNAYGVAANAFCDYFQMGESTACKCCKCFNEAILQCKERMSIYLSIYLQKLMPTDAKKLMNLHFEAWHRWHAWLSGLHTCYLEKLSSCVSGCLSSKAKKVYQPLFWKKWQITTYGFGMQCLNLQ